jgi:hypothetical protein
MRPKPSIFTLSLTVRLANRSFRSLWRNGTPTVTTSCAMAVYNPPMNRILRATSIIAAVACVATTSAHAATTPRTYKCTGQWGIIGAITGGQVVLTVTSRSEMRSSLCVKAVQIATAASFTYRGVGSSFVGTSGSYAYWCTTPSAEPLGHETYPIKWSCAVVGSDIQGDSSPTAIAKVQWVQAANGKSTLPG